MLTNFEMFTLIAILPDGTSVYWPNEEIANLSGHIIVCCGTDRNILNICKIFRWASRPLAIANILAEKTR